MVKHSNEPLSGGHVIVKGALLRPGKLIDDRKLPNCHSTPLVLDCIAKLARTRRDGVTLVFDITDAWMLHYSMRNMWAEGYQGTQSKGTIVDMKLIQYNIDNFQGSVVDGLYLTGLQKFYSYGGVDGGIIPAFSIFEEGVTLDDPSGRCHTYMGICLAFCCNNKPPSVEDLHKSRQLYKEGHRRGCVMALYFLGLAVDISEGIHFWNVGHLAGDPKSTYKLAQCFYTGNGVDKDVPLAIALTRESYARGHPESVWALKTITARNDNERSTTPFSYWCPLRRVHIWVPSSIDLEMVCLLMAKKRPDGPINLLPTGIILMICFYLCTRPQIYIEPSMETWRSAQDERRAWSQIMFQRDVAASSKESLKRPFEVLHNSMQNILPDHDLKRLKG